MSGITGMGTTFNLPNYHGELFAITPSDTPLLSAIGGLTGGGMASSTEFEWQAYDLRDPAQRVQVEGAPAPTADNRVRSNVRNVCQIHQETASVSYTKQSTPGMAASPSAAPYREPDGTNPVTNELDWQVQQKLKEIALDVNWSFINGQYANPTSNASARKTRGLLQAIETNVVDNASSTITGLSATGSTDSIAETGTALANGDIIVFTATGTTGLVAGRRYYVVGKTTDAFKVSTTSGGAAVDIADSTSDVAYSVPSTSDLTVDDIDGFVQQVYDNGGLTGGVATFLANSSGKRSITKAYASAYGKQINLIQGNIAGVSVTKIETDFGVLNIMLDRHVPQDALILLTLDQLKPVFLNVPGKGVFFEEPLAKTGASDDVQIYGEIGLAYGNEMAHGVLRGNKVTA